MTNVHPSAIVHPGAKISPTTLIGPYCIVGKEVVLGEKVELKSHVCIDGITEIGDGTIVFPFASIGAIPQDLKYHGERSRLVIGKNNTIREYVTIQPGTASGVMQTIIGDNCLFMANSHVAHDCVVGNGVIMANSAALAGHATVGEYAIIGGLSGISQFVRIGAHVIIGGTSGVVSDVIPYCSAMGERATLTGLNFVGLKRRNFDKETIHTLRKVFNVLFTEDYATFEKRVQDIEAQYQNNQVVMEVVDFINQSNGRAICFPRNKRVFQE